MRPALPLERLAARHPLDDLIDYFALWPHQVRRSELERAVRAYTDTTADWARLTSLIERKIIYIREYRHLYRLPPQDIIVALEALRHERADIPRRDC